MYESSFKIIPSYQTLAEKSVIDSTGKYIEISKNKSYNYKVKLIKEGLKMINRDRYLEFTEICFDSKEVGKFMFKIIHTNTNRECMLATERGVLYTSAILEKVSKFSRAYVNRTTKKFTDASLLKRHGKNFMLSPYVFYPYVSDLNLKILQEYWSSDFSKSKEQIGSEIQLEINSMLEDANKFIGSTKIEFENLSEIKKLK